MPRKPKKKRTPFTAQDLRDYIAAPYAPLDIDIRKDFAALAGGMSKEKHELTEEESRSLRHMLEDLRDEDPITREEAIQSVLGFGQSAVPLLLSSLYEPDSDADAQLLTLDLIGALGDSMAIQPLWGFYEETNSEHIRSQVLLAIAVLGDEGAAQPSMELLDSEDVRAIDNCVLALTHVGDEFAIRPLVHVYRRQVHPATQENIVGAVAAIAMRTGSEETISLLLEDNEPLDLQLAREVEKELTGLSG